MCDDPEQMRKVSDAAFEAVDEDGSNSLDRSELRAVAMNVAFDMSIKTPTDGDVEAILDEIDTDGDGVVDKDEFFVLIQRVLKTMYDSEVELQFLINNNLNIR